MQTFPCSKQAAPFILARYYVLWNDEEIECDVEKPAGFRTLPLDYYSIRFHLTIRPCICILLSLRLLTGGWSCEPTAKSVLQTNGQICFSARKGGEQKKRESICLFLLIIPSLTVKPSSFFHSRRAVSTCFNTSRRCWRIHHKGNLWHCLFVSMEMVWIEVEREKARRGTRRPCQDLDGRRFSRKPVL